MHHATTTCYLDAANNNNEHSNHKPSPRVTTVMTKPITDYHATNSAMSQPRCDLSKCAHARSEIRAREHSAISQPRCDLSKCAHARSDIRAGEHRAMSQPRCDL